MKECYDHCSGANLYTLPEERNKEHDKIVSRLDGKEHEIMIPPIGNSMAPRNPFQSKSQQRFMFAAEARGDIKKGTAERWAKETPSIKSLPEKKRKK